ncbi:hypothetical protein ISCGN_013794, partial [Ixodes scapularis]
MMEHSHTFLLQSILLSIASNDGPMCWTDHGTPHEPTILEPTTGKQRLPEPVLVDFKLGALGACQHWSSAAMPLQKPLSHASHSGHATTAVMEHSNIFLLQEEGHDGSTCPVMRIDEEDSSAITPVSEDHFFEVTDIVA